jgi:hypothetical protein
VQAMAAQPYVLPSLVGNSNNIPVHHSMDAENI